MESVLKGLSAKAAERWVALLVLPGVFFTLTTALAWLLHPVGAADALDPAVLGDRLDRASSRWPADTGHRLMLAGLATLAAAASAATATELSRPIGRLWLGHGAFGRALLDPFRRHRVREERRRSGPVHHPPRRYLPARATRIGDHLLLTQRRVQAQYHVGLVRVWPRLWQLCDDNERAPVSLAWGRYTAAALRAAWALGYLALGLLWWPAAVAGLVLYLSAWAAARRAAAELSVMVEALTDVKLLDLAAALGIQPAHGRFTRPDGEAVENVLDKGSFVPGPDAS